MIIYDYICIYLSIHHCIFTYVYIYVYVYIFIYIYIYVYIYIYLSIYISQNGPCPFDNKPLLSLRPCAGGLDTRNECRKNVSHLESYFPRIPLPCLFFGSRMPTWPAALASACPHLSFFVSDVSTARRACRAA